MISLKHPQRRLLFLNTDYYLFNIIPDALKFKINLVL